MISLQLFSTSGCHLCELANQLLDEVATEIPLTYEEIEIAGSEHLVELYGVRIPVVRDVVSEKELGWPFDRARLELFLRHL